MFNTQAPTIAGIDIIKEYFTTKSLLIPHKRPAVMVVPERDYPGRVAIP